jgi:hypothetical protein
MIPLEMNLPAYIRLQAGPSVGCFDGRTGSSDKMQCRFSASDDIEAV